MAFSLVAIVGVMFVVGIIIGITVAVIKSNNE